MTEEQKRIVFLDAMMGAISARDIKSIEMIYNTYLKEFSEPYYVAGSELEKQSFKYFASVVKK